jgi:TonB family protein
MVSGGKQAMGIQHYCAAAIYSIQNDFFLIFKTSLIAAAGLLLFSGNALSHSSSRDRMPQFALRNPIARPDSGIIVVAQNRAAERRKPLNVEYEGLRLEGAARLLPKENGEFCWHFRPADWNLPARLLNDGVHHLRVALPGEALSEPLALVWHTQPPAVTAEATKITGSGKVTIAGLVASKIPFDDHQISVNILLNIAQEPISIAIPAQRAADSAGMAIFSFRLPVQGLPKILPGEIGFAQPFFALFVADPAGNHVHYEETYAWFTAPGRKRIGLRPAASRNGLWLFSASAGRRDIDFFPRPAAPATPGAGARKDVVQLNVVKVSERAHQLRWTNPALPARGGQVITLVWRDEQPLAVCFTNQYLDESALFTKAYRYRVEQIVGNGQTFSSAAVCVEAAPPAANEAQLLLAQAFGPDEVAASTEKINARDQDTVAAILAKHKPAIQDCYQHGLRRNYSLKGKVVVRFVVTPQGAVSDAEVISSTLNDSKVEDCMLDRIKRWNDFGTAAPPEGEVAFKQTYLFGY